MNPWQVLTPRGMCFFVVGVCTVIGGIFLGYPDITRVGALLTVLPLLALAIARRRAPQLAVQRTVTPTRLNPDEPGTVHATFRNVGPRKTPMYLAQEHLDVHLGDRPRFVLHPLGRDHVSSLTFQVRSSHRGAYLLGPLSLRQRDPFGLTYVAVRLSSTTEVMVLPRVYELFTETAAPPGRGGDGERPHMVALRGEDDVSIRSYREGDELRRVHWPATAHRGELMVRQEDRPARRRAVLLLDSRSSAHGRAPAASASFEYAVSAIASVGLALLKQGYVVHLLSAQSVRDGSAAQSVDPNTLLDILARAERVDGVPLEAIGAAAQTFTSGGVLAVAAIVAHDVQDIRSLATVCEPGSPALAFVLDRAGFTSESPGRGPAGGEQPAQSRVLGEAGWSTTVCTSLTSIPAAWSALHASRTLGVRS